MGDNIKCFWSYVSNKSRSKNIPKFIQSGDEIASDDIDVCESFSRYFGSVFEQSDTPSLIKSSETFATITLNFVTIEQIKNQIDKLDINKGAGPDGIPPVFFKSCKDSILYPLFIIYNNKSISEGTFPAIWKQAQVIPVFKGGDRRIVKNYRPISILSVPGKMLEAIVSDEIFFATKTLISENQHGFFRGRSVVTNLMSFIQNVSDSMSNRKQVDAVYTDFSKAFDKVHHNTLLVKLGNIGIHGNLLRWITSYIFNRSQCVKINNCSSSYISITSGVPQGSHLGPLLFSLFLYDIPGCFLHSGYCMYADDLKMYKTINSLSDCINLQEDISNLYDYCTRNRLFLNIDKCHYITFSRLHENILFSYHINNSELHKIDSINDLGVILDSKLSFETHIEAITRKAYRNLGFIIRITKSFTNPKSIILLYNSLVRSHLQFASVIWNPFYVKYIERVEKIQMKFVHLLNYKFNRNLHLLLMK